MRLSELHAVGNGCGAPREQKSERERERSKKRVCYFNLLGPLGHVSHKNVRLSNVLLRVHIERAKRHINKGGAGGCSVEAVECAGKRTACVKGSPLLFCHAGSVGLSRNELLLQLCAQRLKLRCTATLFKV